MIFYEVPGSWSSAMPCGGLKLTNLPFGRLFKDEISKQLSLESFVGVTGLFESFQARENLKIHLQPNNGDCLNLITQYMRDISICELSHIPSQVYSMLQCFPRSNPGFSADVWASIPLSVQIQSQNIQCLTSPQSTIIALTKYTKPRSWQQVNLIVVLQGAFLSLWDFIHKVAGCTCHTPLTRQLVSQTNILGLQPRNPQIKN